MDYHTGQVLVDKNAHEQLNPASLTKLMTSYVAGQEMKNGNISKDDRVVISVMPGLKISLILRRCSLKLILK